MKITVFGLLLVSLGFLSVVNVPAAGNGNQVAICHFNGHDGDFVLTGAGGRCDRLEGNILIVGRAACKNGHEAATLIRRGITFDCDVSNSDQPTHF